jgi:hypothetical protein
MELVGGLVNPRAKRGIASSKKYQPDELSVGAREQNTLGTCRKVKQRLGHESKGPPSSLNLYIFRDLGRIGPMAGNGLSSIQTRV